mgnify:CR=1 FL=1
MISLDEFVEWEEVYKNNFYGTLKTEVERIWKSGHHVIFDVDVDGGLNLKKAFGDKKPFAQVVNKGELYRVMATVIDTVKDGIEKMAQNDYPVKVILFKPEQEKETATGFKITDQRAKLYMAYIKQNMDMVNNVRQKGKEIEVILK